MPHFQIKLLAFNQRQFTINKSFISKVRNNNERVLFNGINHRQENKAKLKHKTLKRTLTNFASLFTSHVIDEHIQQTVTVEIDMSITL
jgi:hypothetical protein